MHALLVLLFACAPKTPPAPAVALGPEIVLPCDWAAGTSFTYDWTRLRTDSTKPYMAQMSSVTPLTITIDRPGNPAGVSWKTGATRIDGPEEIIGPFRAALAFEMPPMHLVLTDGAVTDIENQEEVASAMAPVLAGVLPNDDPKVNQILQQTLELMRSPGGKPLILRDPASFFAMHCVALHVGQVIESPMDFPNPLGGPAIPGTSRVELVAHDAAGGTVTFATRDTIDPKATQAVVESAIERFAPGSMTEEQRAEVLRKMPPIDTVVTGQMVYSLADGFPTSVRIFQEIGVEGHPMRRTDERTWTRTSP